jgi:hypothetical protein
MSKKLAIATVAALTALVSPALAAGSGHHHKKTSPPYARVVDPATFGNARDVVDPPAFGNARDDAGGGFGRFPTDYLNQRFGDFQAGGRL